MNRMGADVLMAAAIDGVRQLRGLSHDGVGGFCSIALLVHAAGCPHLHHVVTNPGWFYEPANNAAHAICRSRVQHLFDIDYDEWRAIERDNSATDFLTIAWKYCPQYASAQAETHVDDDDDES
jgi:hypothetical protein